MVFPSEVIDIQFYFIQSTSNIRILPATDSKEAIVAVHTSLTSLAGSICKKFNKADVQCINEVINNSNDSQGQQKGVLSKKKMKKLRIQSKKRGMKEIITGKTDKENSSSSSTMHRACMFNASCEQLHLYIMEK